MASAGTRRTKVLAEFVLIAATGYSVWYLLSYILRRLENLDPDKSDRDELARQSSSILRRLDQNDPEYDPHNKDSSSGSSSNGGNSGGSLLRGGRGKGAQKGRRERMPLTPYEQKIVTEVVAPEDIPVCFDDIGGLDGIIEELREAVIYPLTQPHLFSPSGGSGLMGGGGGGSSLLTAPKGVLLHGPPGCGKTMLAKALAKESGACFINLHISTLTEKWYGDSNKMVNAVFSLARKLQPSIIFIDEIDAVLRSRSSTDHEASAMVKAEFMTHWDGLLSSKAGQGDARILVLGATNRMDDIDEAILRRLPKKFAVGLPDEAQRLRILKLVLKGTKLDEEGGFSFDEIVRRTKGFSGSDLKEACRDAAMVPFREMIRRVKEDDRIAKERAAAAAAGEVVEVEAVDEEQEKARRKKRAEVRGLRTEDFFRKESGGKSTQQQQFNAAIAAIARATAGAGAGAGAGIEGAGAGL